MLRYHTVFPENTKDTYGEYDSVDFSLTFEGRQLVPNSVRVYADLSFANTTNSDPVKDDAALFNFDPTIGAHAFVESYQTEMQGIGAVENFQDAPRFHRMVADTTMTQNDLMNSENACELRAPFPEIQRKRLGGIRAMVPSTQSIFKGSNAGVEDKDGGGNAKDLEFAIKPLFCLNQMSGPLSYQKSGVVRVNLKLSRNTAAMFDQDAGNYKYILKNLRLKFVSAPDSGVAAVTMRTKLNIKQSVNSAFMNVATKVPAVCSAVSCSFQKQTDENQAVPNNVACEVLPNVRELQFLFNDSQNEYVSYLIEDRGELLHRYLESFGMNSVNNMPLSKIAANDGYGIGLNFRDQIDLSDQKFNIQLTSDIGSNSNTAYIIYMYFHSTVSV